MVTPAEISTAAPEEVLTALSRSENDEGVM
jgi:hypothetical protein